MFCCQIFGLNFFHGIQLYYQIFVMRLTFKQFLFHFFSFFIIGLILFKNTFLYGFYLGLNVSKSFGIKGCMLSLLSFLNLLLLKENCIFLFFQSLQFVFRTIQSVQQLFLLISLFLDGGHGQEQSGAIKLLLFNALIVLKFSFDQSEQFLIILFHDIIDLHFELTKLCLKFFYYSFFLLFSFLLFLFVFFHFYFLLLVHLLDRLVHPFLSLHGDLKH